MSSVEPIILNNISVEGIPITYLTDFSMHSEVNSIGTASIEGQASYENANAFCTRTGAGSVVTISTTASGQPPVIFKGIVKGASVSGNDEQSILRVDLEAMASVLNNEKENHSYQQMSATFEDIIKKALNSKADLKMSVSDRASNQLIMQYNETPWEFSKRMASNVGGVLCANVTTDVPQLTVGMPTGTKSYDIETVNYGITSNGNTVTSKQYCEIGDKVKFNGGQGNVCSVDAVLISGMLQVTVGLSMPDGFANQPVISNPCVSGRMMTGIVQGVEKDKVQVHFVDVDASYGGGDLWLPYSTAYSSSDGSGFYCMPEAGDTVRVFMPSDNEGDAFAASSVNTSPLDNPKHKKWKSPAGKEILLTETGMYITCKDKKIFINLEDENGITICSDSDINVMTMNNMLVYAQKELKIQAENKILLSTGQSYIDMTPKEIQLGGEKVTIK